MSKSAICTHCKEEFAPFVCEACGPPYWPKARSCKECHDEVAHGQMPPPGIMDSKHSSLSQNLAPRQAAKLN